MLWTSPESSGLNSSRVLYRGEHADAGQRRPQVVRHEAGVVRLKREVVSMHCEVDTVQRVQETVLQRHNMQRHEQMVRVGRHRLPPRRLKQMC